MTTSPTRCPRGATGEGRDERDEARGRVRLLYADDRNRPRVAVVAANLDRGTEPNLVAVRGRRRERGRRDSQLQLGATRGQRVVVRSVGRGHHGQLVAERLEASWRHIVRHARWKRRAVTWDLGERFSPKATPQRSLLRGPRR
jgi:hypothetical protein